MDLVIRPSQPADIAAITGIYADAVVHGTASFELEPPTEQEMARRRSALVDGGFPYLVAERGGALLGYAYAGPYRTRPAYRFTVEDSVYVARSAQRAGVGRALLSALVDAAEARRFRLMVAATRRQPAPSACTKRSGSTTWACSSRSATSTGAGSPAC